MLTTIADWLLAYEPTPFVVAAVLIGVVIAASYVIFPSPGARNVAADRGAVRDVAPTAEAVAAAAPVLAEAARVSNVQRRAGDSVAPDSCGCPYCSQCRLLRSRGKVYIDGHYVTVN